MKRSLFDTSPLLDTHAAVLHGVNGIASAVANHAKFGETVERGADDVPAPFECPVRVGGAAAYENLFSFAQISAFSFVSTIERVLSRTARRFLGASSSPNEAGC